MANTRGQRYTVEQFAAAIPGSGGIIATISRRVGCDWHTARTRIDESATLTKLINSEEQTIDDLAESVVIKAMQEGDIGAAKWWLERRRRGKYATRVENEISGAGDGLHVIVEYVNRKDNTPGTP
jgi:hypothetical protein